MITHFHIILVSRGDNDFIFFGILKNNEKQKHRKSILTELFIHVQ